MEKTICGIKFNLPKYGGKILEDYLDKVKKYVKDNKLENELYNDIENRIAEKLSQHKEITDMHIINLLNELGEVEEIFEQEGSEETLKKTEKYNPLFLGLFSYLGNRFNINPWIFRIVYIVFVIAPMSAMEEMGGLWILINIVVYIAVANRYNNKLNIRGGVKGVLSSLVYAFRELFLILIKLVKFFLKYIFLFIFIFFSIFLGGMALVGGPFFLTDLTISNQIIFANISVYLPYGLLVFGVVFCILGVAAILGLFKKKLLNSLTIFVLIGILFLSVASIFLGIYQTVGKYTTIYEKVQRIDLGVLTGSELSGENIISNHISLITDLKGDYLENIRLNPFESEFKIEKSSNQNIYVFVKTFINSNTQENANKVFTKMNDLQVYLSGNILYIKDPSNLFNKPTVYSLPRKQIILQIPEHISFDIKQSQYNYFYRTPNFFSTGYFTDCYNANIFFDKKLGQFVCTNPEAEIQGCKNFFEEEKNDCRYYLNSYEILNCKKILENLSLSGSISNYSERQMLDYKYCTDVLYRKKTRECEYLIGTGQIYKDMRYYELINYCNVLTEQSN